MRKRQLFEYLGKRQQQEIEHLDNGRQRLADAVCVALDIGVEQCFGHNLQRQPHHFVVDVEYLAIPPAIGHFFRVIGHRTCIFGDPQPVKRGLHHAALAEMRFIFARQQAVAEQPFGTLEGAALNKFVGVDNQHVTDQVRMVDEIHACRAHSESCDITESGLAS